MVFPREDFLCVLHAVGRGSESEKIDEGQFRHAVRQKLIDGDCNFARVTFPFDMEDEFKNCLLKDASFRGACFLGKARFDKARFIGQCSFEYVDFNDVASFTGSSFSDGAVFRIGNRVKEAPYLVFTDVHFEKPEDIEFAEFDASRTYLLGTRMRGVRFTGITWPTRLMEEVLASSRRNRERVEWLYRELRVNFEGSGNYPDANRFYRGEMDMRRKAVWWRRYLPSLTTLYWLASGYGLQPTKALLVILILFALFSVSYTQVGLERNANVGDSVPAQIDLTTKSRLAFASNVLYGSLHALQVLTLSSNMVFHAVGWEGATLTALQTVVMPVQVALFALAIRRKFHR